MRITTALRLFPALMLPLVWALPGSAAAQEEPAIGVNAGEMYPDFLLPTLDGEQKRFSDYRGKKILLFHFASW